MILSVNSCPREFVRKLARNGLAARRAAPLGACPPNQRLSDRRICGVRRRSTSAPQCSKARRLEGSKARRLEGSKARRLEGSKARGSKRDTGARLAAQPRRRPIGTDPPPQKFFGAYFRKQLNRPVELTWSTAA